MKAFSNLCHPSYVVTILCIVFFQLEHERVWNSQRFTQIQLRVVTQQWQRDHEELLVRALVTLEEARHAHQKEMELQKDRQQQQEICLQLREKVCVWNDYAFDFFKVHFLCFMILFRAPLSYLISAGSGSITLLCLFFLQPIRYKLSLTSHSFLFYATYLVTYTGGLNKFSWLLVFFQCRLPAYLKIAVRNML